jgi:cytochrome c oxidase subunit 2
MRKHRVESGLSGAFRTAAAIGWASWLAGCSGNPSIFDPAAPSASAIADLFWFFIAVCTIVYLLTIGALFWAILRSRRAGPERDAASEGWAGRFVGAATIMTVVILFVFVGVSFATDRRILYAERDPVMQVELTGHQWWWEIRYLDEDASKVFRTANELHLPLGQRVQLNLKSADVIHSVWLPNLAGKKDVIPGRNNILTIEVDKPGIWHGRCAEFCGYQHAHMDLTVVAESAESFSKWRDGQIQPAHQPETDEQRKGEQVFASSACVLCHVIRGSAADGQSTLAPDLTHLMSRQTIGAGTVGNEKGFLGGWILDPHGFKPGVHMPMNLLRPSDFQPLLDYLETLR